MSSTPAIVFHLCAETLSNWIPTHFSSFFASNLSDDCGIPDPDDAPKQALAPPARSQKPTGYAASGLRKLMLSAQGDVIVAAAAATAAAAASDLCVATAAAAALAARQVAEQHASSIRAAHSKVVRENDEKVVGLQSLPQVASLFLPVNSQQRRAGNEPRTQSQATAVQPKAVAVKTAKPAAVTRYLPSSPQASQQSRQFSPRVSVSVALSIWLPQC